MNPYEDPEALLKLVYVAELVGVTPEYLSRQIKLGRLGGYRIGREWRVSRQQLAEWLRMVEWRSRVAWGAATLWTKRQL
jgi:excisionase family DNA binding protein